MAQNETTYTATIDVETTGMDSFDKLNKELEGTLEGFIDMETAISNTRKALQKAKLDGNKAEFKRLRKELNGLEDQFEDTTIQSKRFTDALAEQPGIVGLVGGSLKGLDGGMKVLAANPIIAVVTLLAGLFLLFKESLTKTAEGQESLNRISAAFGKILGPVMAVIEAVALPIFEKLADLLELVGKGFSRFAKFLGISSGKIEEASRNSSEVLQTAYEEEETRQEEQTKTQEEQSKKRIDNAKKEAEDKADLLKTAGEIQNEAELSLLDDKQREIKEREVRFNEEMAVLKAAGYTNFKALEAEYRSDLAAIDESYKEEVIDTTAADEEKRLADEATRKELESEKRQNDLNFIMADYELKKALGVTSFEDELAAFDQTREIQRAELVAQDATNKQLITYDKQTSKARIDIEKSQQAAKLGVISGALDMISEAVGANSVAGKAAAIASATINTYIGATKALATYPPPFGAIAAGVTIAGGLLQVRKIVSTKIPKPPGGSLPASGGGGGGAGGGASIPTIQPPQIETGGAGAGNVGSQISETIASSSNRPVQAFVVSTEVSSTQALDRRTNSSATFGSNGG